MVGQHWMAGDWVWVALQNSAPSLHPVVLTCFPSASDWPLSHLA